METKISTSNSLKKKNPLSVKETTSGTVCVCSVRMSRVPARANTCELKVARGRSIHVYASRTLIQDCEVSRGVAAE